MAPMKDERVLFSRLSEGVCMALDRAAQLVEDADALLGMAGRKYGAAVLFSQAAEEVGKASMLIDARSNGSPDADEMIVVKGFLDHSTKLRKAQQILPQSVLADGEAGADGLLVVDDYYNADAYFDADIVFGDRVSAGEQETRQNWLYLGWDRKGNRWRDVPAVNVGLLAKNIALLRSFIADKRRGW